MNKNEKINLIATILGPVVVLGAIAWVSWSFNARMTIERQSADKFNADTYVPKVWFQAAQAETNKRLDALTSEVNGVQQDVAQIKGELGRKHN